MKSKFFILYEHGMELEISWPEGWGNTCRANLSSMLGEVLNVNTISIEIKGILNGLHHREMVNKYDVTYEDVEDYVKSSTGSIHFQSAGTRKRAAKSLMKMGAENLVFVNSYRDLILYQAHHYNHGKFPSVSDTCPI